MSAELAKQINELGRTIERIKSQCGSGDMNTILLRGDVVTCSQLEDAIGCWGWIAVDEETAIGFKVYGQSGLRFLETMTKDRSDRRVIFFGELRGKPAEVVVNFWMIS